jgi:hypothetical protein
MENRLFSVNSVKRYDELIEYRIIDLLNPKSAWIFPLSNLRGRKIVPDRITKVLHKNTVVLFSINYIYLTLTKTKACFFGLSVQARIPDFVEGV